MYCTGNLGNFIDDFDQFLGDTFLRFERFLLCGDINIHLDEDNPQSRAFSDTIASYGLYQLVTETTHKDGHLLDIVVASHKVVKNNIIRVNNQSQKDFPTCDHFPLLYELEYCASAVDGKKKIMFRNLKHIDTDIFSFELDLALKKAFDKKQSFKDCIEAYNQACAKTLDDHAPEYMKMINDLPTAPWFDSEYKNMRRERRKAEKKAKKPGSTTTDYKNFTTLREKCNALAKHKKTAFYQTQFARHNYSQKSLYQFVDTFLDHSKDLTLPSHSDSESLQTVVENFNPYFTTKIEQIRKSFTHSITAQEQLSTNSHSTSPNFLTNFDLSTVDEIREIIKESDIIT